MPRKPKPVDDLFARPREYLIPTDASEQLGVVYASTVTSISEIPRVMSLWGDTEEGMLHPEQIVEADTLYTQFTELLGPYFFQYREFPVVEYLVNMFLERGELPVRDYFREYMPDKSPEERLELVSLLQRMFRNTLGAYRGSLLHFLDVIAPTMIDDPHADPKDLLQHVPSYSPYQREILSGWMHRSEMFSELGQFFMLDDEQMERFTPAQMAFLGELVNNGKLEDYEQELTTDLSCNPQLGLTPELANRIFEIWLVYMITSEFPEGILLSADNASKIYYCDRVILDGINLIRNWFQVCEQGMPRVIRMHSLKETDIYIKIKWRLEDMEAALAEAEPLPAAVYDPLDDWGRETEFTPDGQPVPAAPERSERREVHCMFRTREDQMVPNDDGGFDVFDRKTGQPEEAGSIAAQIADLVTLIAAQGLAYSGYAHKPKGKMFYLEFYADEIPEITSRLAHIGVELNNSGTGFIAVNRSIKPEEIPERMRLLTRFVYNLVAHKQHLRSPLYRQKLSLSPSPTSMLDRKPPKPPKHKVKGEPPELVQKPLL